MHVRMNMLAGDPARMNEATRYLEETVRPDVEAQHGNRGLACLFNADLGICVVASYWDTLDAMTASEQAVQVARKEVTERVGGTVTVEHYEVPAFVRRSRPQRGAGVRMTRLDGAPASMDAMIEEFRNTAVPSLTAMPGLCSAQMMTDRSGRPGKRPPPPKRARLRRSHSSSDVTLAPVPRPVRRRLGGSPQGP